MNQPILHRQGNEVQLYQEDGEVAMSINVPSNMSALALMGTHERNQWQPGDDIQKDGWVISKNGNRRKWFVKFENVFVWGPKFENVALCEAKRWRAYQLFTKFHQENWATVSEMVRKAMPFCGYKTGGRSQSSGYVKFVNYYTDGIGWRWAEEIEQQPTDIPLNQEACDTWFTYEKRLMEVGNRSWLFREVFRQALSNKFREYIWQDEKKAIHAVINNRSYWLTRPREHDHYNVDIFIQPEDIFDVEIM